MPDILSVFLIIFFVILCIALILLFAAGYFLVNFTLKRKWFMTDWWISEPVDITKLEPGSPKFIIETNYRDAIGRVNHWLDSGAFENVFMTSRDGLRLAGYVCKAEVPTHKWVMMVHGFRDNPPSSILTYALRYAEKGYNVFYNDHRAHGDSEGRYITMGYMEHYDLIDWINEILKMDPDAEIVLHGHSMGAATLLMATGEESLPKNVKVAVADCGFSSVWDEFSSTLRSMFHLPAFPFLNFANIVSKIVAGFDFRDGNTVEYVKKSNTPTFFAHGDMDDFVPTFMVNKLYDAANCDKKLYIAKNARHVDSQYIDPELYFSQVFEFVEKYISD